jgi:hypothetical protein
MGQVHCLARKIFYRVDCIRYSDPEAALSVLVWSNRLCIFGNSNILASHQNPAVAVGTSIFGVSKRRSCGATNVGN